MRGFWNFIQHSLILFSIAGQSTAQLEDNPISHPKQGEIIAAGSIYTITWTPNKGVIVSIELYNGFSIASSFNGANCYINEFVPTCSELFSNVTNTGSMVWHVPTNAPISDQYYLDIYVPNPGVGGPFYYMTGNFSIRPASMIPSTTTQIPTISLSSSTRAASSSTSASSTTASNVPFAATATVTGNALCFVLIVVAPSPSPESSGPSPGVIGGAVGAVIGIALAIGLGVAIFILRKKKKNNATVEPRTSGRTDNGWYGDKIEMSAQAEHPVHEDKDERVGGRIRYPEPDDYDSGVVGGRLRSYD
jgi:hypothetical protein